MTAPQTPAACRECLADISGDAAICPKCGGRRIVRHAELDILTVAHLDCDAFYASIEKRDNPALADRPVIVGGGKRGVVTTACYIARQFGVRSAMPMFKALKACPQAVVVAPDMAKYVAVGREVRTLMQAVTPLVEPLSIDEAFLDLAGTERLHGASPARVLIALARRIEAEIGITVSIGLSFNKFLAKVASDLDKPRGFSVVGRAEALDFLEPKPVGIIFGVGRVFQRHLADDGFVTIGDLRRAGEAALARRYGGSGERLYRLSMAEDFRTVEARGEAKSVSSETTFETDIGDPATLRAILRRLSERVSDRLKAANIAGRTITLKLKTADFAILTRRRQLADPTRLADRIFAMGDALLGPEADGTRYRLLGIGVSDLSDGAFADPADLADPNRARRAAAETAMDDIRARFGRAAVDTGIVFDHRQRRG